MALSLRLLGDRSGRVEAYVYNKSIKYDDVFRGASGACSMTKTVAALQYAFEGRNLAAENHKVVVYAAERRAPMHRTGTN